MKFTSKRRQAEEFDRALREDSADGAYASELHLTALLCAAEVRPDPAFTADLRASLLEAAREVSVRPVAVARPARTRRRWTIAAPAAAVVLATSGIAFAVTGLQTTRHPAPVTQSPAASVLSTAQAEIATLRHQLRAGEPTADSLTTLRAEAMHLRDTLLAAYASGQNPQALLELHDFALSAFAELAAKHAQIPMSLTSLYASTLQTLVDIASAAEATCPSCGLPKVQVPTSVAPYVHMPVVAPAPTPSASTTAPTPQDTSSPSTPVTTPPSTVPTTPATPTSPATVPTIPPPPLPSPTVSLPIPLPTLPL